MPNKQHVNCHIKMSIWSTHLRIKHFFIHAFMHASYIHTEICVNMAQIDFSLFQLHYQKKKHTAKK
jgi:hypothetical protein